MMLTQLFMPKPLPFLWANFQNTFLDIFLSWRNRGIWLGQSQVSFRFLLKMEMFGPCCIWLCIFVLCQFGLASTFNLDFSLNQRRIGSGAGEVQNWRCLFYSLHSRMFSSFTLCALACFPLLTLSLYWFAHSNVLFLVCICLSVFFCKLLLQPTVLFAFFANCRDRSLSLFPVFANYCICPLFGKFCKSSHQITITIPYVQTCAQYHHPLCFVCTLFDKSFSTTIFDIWKEILPNVNIIIFTTLALQIPKDKNKGKVDRLEQTSRIRKITKKK